MTTDMPTWSTSVRTPSNGRRSARRELNDRGLGYGNDFFGREFWRFVTVQEAVEKLALTAIDYPPMQDPASFNLSAVKAQIEELRQKAQSAHPGN